MANKAISELPQAQNVNNQDLFVLEQSGIAKKLTAETFITEQGIIDALAEALDGHGGIQSVTLSSVSGRIRTYRITFTDQSATTFQVYDGTSIDRISRTSSSGLDDVYTIFLSDGTTTFFTVHNGADGTVSEAMLNDALKDKAPAITETTESSAIANFTDGADDMPLHNILAEINPVQDLTYGDPYPAGSGKNLLPKGENRTTNGITFTVADDGSVSATGTSTATAFWGSQFTIPAGTYTFSGCPTNSLGIVCDIRSATGGGGISGINAEAGSGSTFTRTDALTAWFNIRIPSGVTVNNLVFYPQIETGSAKTSFAPYSNICPITGWTGCNVTRAGKNLFDPTNVVQGSINGDNGIPFGSTTRIRSNNFISLKQGTYTISVNDSFNISCYIYGTDESYIQSESYRGWSASNQSTITLVGDRKVLFIFKKADNSAIVPSDLTTPMLELGSTATAYEPYQGNTVTLSWTTEAGTVYGGTIDVATGLLTVDRGIITINGSEGSWLSEGVRCPLVMPNTYADSTVGRISIICDTFRSVMSGGTAGDCFGYFNSDKRLLLYFYPFNGENLSQFKSWLSSNNTQVVYPLATPQTYQLTPQEVKTLLGTNNVWADTGNVTVKYPADTKMFIEKLTMPTEDDLVANQAITSGKYFMIGNSLYLALANIASGAQITIGTNAQRVSLADALNAINS